MTFGKGFTFSGSQVHYDKLRHDHWVDLLFFNRILRATVVVEIKKGKFKPNYLGQLSHYLHVIDDDDRLEWENAPVGIILCKDADRTFVEYVLQDYQRPVAGYGIYQYVPHMKLVGIQCKAQDGFIVMDQEGRVSQLSWQKWS